MERDYAESLLRSGIIEAKAGEKETARHYLQRAINTGDDFATLTEAWYWLSMVTDDPVQKRTMLENCLSYDLHHARARRELAILDGKLKPDEIIDPNAPPAASTNPTQAEADRFMCPKCGTRMVYAPDGSTLICEHCTSGQHMNRAGEAEEQDFLIAMATARGHGKPVATQVIHCQGCGVEFILPPDIISVTCAYCGSPYVVSLEDSRDLLEPEGIIPHAFDQQQANSLLVDWVKQNGIAPQEKINDPRGVYLPIWTFDIGGEIDYTGDRMQAEGELYSRKGTRVIHVKDSYAVSINDLSLPASRKIASHFDRFLPTYELTATRSYDPHYLSNWPAEVYDVPMADASLDARSRAYSQLKRRLPPDISSLYNLQTSSANLTIDSFKLVLLPVWLAEIPAKDKKALVLINGQNGILQGDSSRQVKPKNGLINWLEDLLDD